MNAAKRRFVLSGLKLFDISLLILSFGLASALVAYGDEGVGLERFLSMRVKLSNCIAFVSIVLAWHMIFSFCGLYESRRLSARRAELVDVLKATALSSALLAVLAESHRITMITPSFLVSFWLVSSFLLTASRLVLRPLLASLRRHGRNLRYVLVLGTNLRAIDFARKIEAKPELGYRILGFVDDEWHGMSEFKQTGFPLVSAYKDLSEFLRRNVVDEVAMYLPFGEFYEASCQAAALCEQHGITLRFDGDIFGLKKSRSTPDEFDGHHYVATSAETHDWWPLVIKRILDIAFSLILLILLAPVLVVVAALIQFYSPGPVLFRQERIGLNKRRFLIFKFRTMVRNAEKMMAELESHNEVSGPVFKIKNDPRITPMGKILRRTSIDELPQLFNVLKGDMSLVGPRPLPVRDYEGFSEDWQRRRFSVRPGITCLWQVSGRSSLPFEQWMKLDLQYMDEWSLWLDIKILAQTVSAVLKGSGAA
ncbi:MAG TPA: sugar transferase [Candidatus Acidoferrales bacterium]|nr:sugar transferase [Candidatus Acidoferrales bacterium]